MCLLSSATDITAALESAVIAEANFSAAAPTQSLILYNTSDLRG